MKRLQLTEIEDICWLPSCIRNGMTDFLGFILHAMNFYAPVTRVLQEGLMKSDEHTIIDLCSGSGKNLWRIQSDLERSMGKSITCLLSDKYPNFRTYSYLASLTQQKIRFSKLPVDVERIPPDFRGFRTMFSAAHHFPPETLKSVLKNAVKDNTGIGVFDGGNRSFMLVVCVIILFPVLFFFCTPFIKPFKWSSIFFTYAIPLIPAFTIWDGIVSIFRLYTPGQLLAISKELKAGHFVWTTGKLKNKLGLKITYLIGIPEYNSGNHRNREILPNAIEAP